MCRDFLESDTKQTKILIYRHFAWLTALRYQMRESRLWEKANKPYNAEYRNFFVIPEQETKLEDELKKYINDDELKYVLSTKNRAVQLMSLQSKTIKLLFEQNRLIVINLLKCKR